jgi:[acyl-carrier-protein] S-malonyltransferase
MSLAFLFPGQGVDAAAVAGDWYARSAHARTLLDQAAAHVGVPIGRLLHGSGQALRDTAAYQPVLTAMSVGALLELTARGVRADVVAGHSLGELAALVAAGAVAPDAAVALAATRGRAMARAAEHQPGGMLALSARSRTEAEEAMAHALAHGRAQIAAHNAPDEWVLAGEWSALRAVPPRFAPVRLDTGGPWHSAAMSLAVSAYREALRDAIVGPLRIPVVCNRTGQLIGEADDLAELLAGQLTHPVEWTTTMETVSAMSVRTIITVGPAKPLRGLARRNLGREIQVLGVDSPSDLTGVAEALAA